MLKYRAMSDFLDVIKVGFVATRARLLETHVADAPSDLREKVTISSLHPGETRVCNLVTETLGDESHEGLNIKSRSGKHSHRWFVDQFHQDSS